MSTHTTYTRTQLIKAIGLNEGSELAKTAITPSIKAIYDRVCELRGSKPMYGVAFKLASLIPEGQAADTPLFAASGEVADFVIFRSEKAIWHPVVVITCTPEAKFNPGHDSQYRNFCGQHGIEHIGLTDELVVSGYLQTRDFAARVKRAVFAPNQVRFHPLPRVPATGWTERDMMTRGPGQQPKAATPVVMPPKVEEPMHELAPVVLEAAEAVTGVEDQEPANLAMAFREGVVVKS